MKILSKNIELNMLYTIKNPLAGHITHQGQRDILDYCIVNDIPYPNFGEDGLGNEWRVTKGKYSGTFTKRFSNWLFKEHDYLLSAQHTQTIGNICQRHVSEISTFYYDFTNRFDWKSGDFGDPNSCLMLDKQVLPYMESRGIMALRVYKEAVKHDLAYPTFKDVWPSYRYKYGLGRAWFIIGKGKSENNLEEGTAILFNGYGDLEVHPTLSLARLMCNIFGVSYKEVPMTINGQYMGRIWINGKAISINGQREHHGVGFVLGSVEALNKIPDERKLNIHV